MLEHLIKLKQHLYSLDSGSKDAEAINWAILKIGMLEHKLEVARDGLRDVASRANNRLANTEPQF